MTDGLHRMSCGEKIQLKKKQKNPGEKQDSQLTTTPKLYKTQLLKYTTVLYPNQLWQVQ